MRNQLTLTILMFCFNTTIMGNIRDFIIETENDLKRFGLSPETERRYEDDFESEWTHDECGNGGAVSAGDDSYNPYGEYQANGVADNDYDMSQVDPSLLREIVRQMKNDPRFEHLWEHLNEENVILQQKMTDYIEDRSDYFVDIDENYDNNEIDW